MVAPVAPVGESPPRPDGADKVTGRALFVDDLSLPGAWHGVAVRCPHPRARVLAVDTEPARALEPDLVVLTARNLPSNVVHVIADDWPALADREVHHAYEPVALVAAPTRARALAAAAAVHVRYEVLPATLGLDAALAEGDAAVLARSRIDHGDLEAAFAAADLVVEGTYETGHQEHLYLEPQGMIAVPLPDGGLELVGSLQCPYFVQGAVSRFTGLPPAHVRVRQAVTGGGFGGKEDVPDLLACHAAALALRAGRPVKIVYDRREDIIATSKRHPSRVHVRSAVARDGTFLAHDIQVLFDAGAYTTMSAVVLSRGVLHASGPYRAQAVRVRGLALRTHTTPNGAFRGFGAPQTQFAMERHVDRIARAVGLDPLEVRRRNALVEGDVTATGQVLTSSVGALACLDEAARRSDFAARWRRNEAARTRGGRVGPWRGLGLSLYWHGGGFTGNGEKRIQGRVDVALTGAGLLEVRTAAADIGQGVLVAFAQIAASAAGGLPLEQVRTSLPDTAVSPDSGPTVASRTIMVVGELVARASRLLVAELEAFASERLAAPAVCWGGELVSSRGRLPFREVAREYLAARGPLERTARFEPLPGQEFDEETYRGMAYPAYSWGSDVIEVEVDPDTLETRVVSALAVCDVGRVVHPVLCAGQVEGGTLQALGWGGLEEMKTAGGHYLNDRFATYIVPTALDAPPLEAVLLEHPGPMGFGAKGVGELPLDGGAPALLGAIANATGLELASLPATPERLLEGLERDARVPAVAAPRRARAARPAARSRAAGRKRGR